METTWFFKGRVVIDNIIEIEAAGIACHVLNSHHIGLVFLDFGSAFPSLLQQWLSTVL